MLPIFAFAGMIAMVLARFIGAGIVILISIFGLGTLLIHDAISSTPMAQLKRMTRNSSIPDVTFEDFSIGRTFSDGTSYMWIARCSPIKANRLSKAIGMKPISPADHPDEPTTQDPEHQAMQAWQMIFHQDIEGMNFYLGDQGMIGGYSSEEQRFYLFWWPSIHRDNPG
ncbi:hypothetical protein JIN85_19455 [Luteolibacter pohnpeiensis]|uniref:Uncharacterized protein n=1 Tax=Luteolibacter pohnpeiensis TaxID=454153 RepID=A0A934VWH0_9BACT|nr:hypothetical protein [Luteolibacter pohnpeiensis]MBK1884602.1 hypothetical protein [Luteolibacter pohnpeiensis]